MYLCLHLFLNYDNEELGLLVGQMIFQMRWVFWRKAKKYRAIVMKTKPPVIVTYEVFTFQILALRNGAVTGHTYSTEYDRSRPFCVFGREQSTCNGRPDQQRECCNEEAQSQANPACSVKISGGDDPLRTRTYPSSSTLREKSATAGGIREMTIGPKSVSCSHRA